MDKPEEAPLTPATDARAKYVASVAERPGAAPEPAGRVPSDWQLQLHR